MNIAHSVLIEAWGGNMSLVQELLEFVDDQIVEPIYELALSNLILTGLVVVLLLIVLLLWATGTKQL